MSRTTDVYAHHHGTDHDLECAQETADIRAKYAAYVARWPNHCRHCGGYGSFYLPGTWTQPPEYDSCPHCMENGVCPRCGGRRTPAMA
jgi:hypothetical protein